MTIGFTSRTVVSACALCTASLLVSAPTVAIAGVDPGPRTTAGALLYRPGTQVRPRPGAPEVPDPSALSWLVADAGTGDVLAAHDAHRPLPPASTLKTLFALTVLPTLPAGIRHRVRERELAGIGPGSSLVGVAEDRTYRVSDLWNGVFLSSGNDAVRVLAALSGGWRATAERMQAKARALGARDTRVKSPDGYDAPGQVSSAFDLAVFGRAGLRNHDFARYCGRREALFPARDGGTYGIVNTNRLLTGQDGVEPYDGLLGIKNGYTSNAGNTLVTAAHRDGHTLVVTVMNPRSGGGHAVYEEARTLLDWGFEATGQVDPVGTLNLPHAGQLSGPQADTATIPPARPGNSPAHHPSWPIVAAALAGAASVSLYLRLRWGPALTHE
ncbi:D-alanyl-D-alanine carboxypeptidase family protein [Streptomyces sp. NPDC090114]|uniref:D-alanyl-D-alanine carboxypeptidase family protein n=1 Tax=Streptomyces sp. NPDC090114 TaxID=3365950 RepID=UPI0037F36545